MKRIILCLLAAVLLSGVLAGCGESESEKTLRESEERLKESQEDLAEAYGKVFEKFGDFQKKVDEASGYTEEELQSKIRELEQAEQEKSASTAVSERKWYTLICERGITETQFETLLVTGMPYDVVMAMLDAKIEPKPTDKEFYCKWESPTTEAVVSLCFIDDELYMKVGASLSEDEEFVPAPIEGDLTDGQITPEERKTTIPYASELTEKFSSVFHGLNISEHVENTGFEYREDVSMPKNSLYEYYFFFTIGETEVAADVMELDSRWTIIGIYDADTKNYYYMMPSLEEACDIYDFNSGELIKKATTTMSELAGK